MRDSLLPLRKTVLAITVGTLVLAACGGGGDGDGSPTTVQAVNSSRNLSALTFTR